VRFFSRGTNRNGKIGGAKHFAEIASSLFRENSIYCLPASVKGRHKVQKSNPNLSGSIFDCLLIQLHADRYTSSAAVRPELRDSLMCLKGIVSCLVSCTELSKIRHTTKTMLQVNITPHPGQTHSALSDAVVILTSFLFHRGLLQSYVHNIYTKRERIERGFSSTEQLVGGLVIKLSRNTNKMQHVI
jgi:hypothetical protein